MTAKSSNLQSLPIEGTKKTTAREVLLRLASVALCAATAHSCNWHYLTYGMSESVLRLSASVGIACQRVTNDTIVVRGEYFSIVTACTFADVYLGAVPLLWEMRKSIQANILRVFAFGLILFPLNVCRLEVAQLLHIVGVPWLLADEVLGGAAYFIVLRYLLKLHEWDQWLVQW